MASGKLISLTVSTNKSGHKYYTSRAKPASLRHKTSVHTATKAYIYMFIFQVNDNNIEIWNKIR